MELMINKLTKEFNNINVVNNVSYTMKSGVYALLGVNGAGKTTFMRMICTLLTPTSGTITWNGENINTLGSEYRNILGYLPQEFGFYPDFTVQDYLLYIASIKGILPMIAKNKIDIILNQVGMTKERNKKMKKLSGGMKRRIGIAQAILNDPKILILDEPTAGLDPNERIRFRNLISELAKDRIVLLSTHIVSDVEYIANEIILMKDGIILNSGTTEQIILSMEEKVWICTIDQNKLNDYINKYKICNIKTMGNNVELRIISEEKPKLDAILEAATLEDVFLYYFGGNIYERND